MTFRGVILPTDFRHLHGPEWDVVDPVFGSTLPYRFRVFVSNGIGLYNTPFTVPTSVLSSAFIAAGISNPLLSLAGIGGLISTPARLALGVSAGYGASVVNGGFVMNVGPKYFANLLIDDDGVDTLVHEMVHVWQGKNGLFALSSTLGAVAAQCKGMSVSGGFSGRHSAYTYTITSPLAPWGGFNPEQQAKIVEDWYRLTQFGMPSDLAEAKKRFPYIDDYVRKGKTS